MYQFIDRPVTCLDKGCRFLIWSMRSWVVVARDRQCPGHALAPAFAKWRMIGGLQPFLRLMLVLDREALEPVRFCSLRCNRIAEHEAVLLSLFVGMASGDSKAVRDTLSLLVSEDAVGDALGAISAIITSLAEADIAPCAPNHAES